MERTKHKGILARIRNKGLVIVALTASLIGVACDPLFDPEHCSQVPQETNSDRILAIGDSITAFWSKAHANSCQSYSDYASKEINEYIQNHAIGGTKLSSPNGMTIPQQYEKSVEVYGPYDLVILTGGGNDLMYECPVAWNETCSVKCREKLVEVADEMETLVTDIVRDGSHAVIVGYYPTRYPGSAVYNECLEHATAEYKKIADVSPHVSFVDTADLVDPREESNYFDGGHPSIELTQKIGKRVAAAIMDAKR